MSSQESIADGDGFTLSFSQDQCVVLYEIRSQVANSFMVESQESSSLVKEEDEMFVLVVGQSL